MIKDIYCYDLNTAKKNKFRVSILGMIGLISLMLFILVFFIVHIIMNIIDNKFLIFTLFIIWLFFLILVIVKYSMRVSARMTGIIVDEANKIYILINLRNGTGTMVVSNASGNIIGQVANSSELASGIKFVGNTAAIMRLSCSMNDMSDPEKVRLFFYEADRSYMFRKIRLDKINNVVEKSKYFAINCDYTDVKNNKTKFNKKIKIYKVYNNMDNLINLLKSN